MKTDTTMTKERVKIVRRDDVPVSFRKEGIPVLWIPLVIISVPAQTTAVNYEVLILVRKRGDE